MGLFNKLKKAFNKKDHIESYDKGLEKTRKEFVSELSLLGLKFNKVTEEYYEELESILIKADIGIRTVESFL
ncbi:MAG: signal recognition particle receptor subunit alpha, partial [Bacilli bacterium]